MGGAGVTGAFPAYGDLLVDERGDGTLTVTRADDYIAVDTDLLDKGPDHGLTTDPSGMLIFAGSVGYLPMRFIENGRVVVCRKTWTIQPGVNR
jgi:hypothetical protein